MELILICVVAISQILIIDLCNNKHAQLLTVTGLLRGVMQTHVQFENARSKAVSFQYKTTGATIKSLKNVNRLTSIKFLGMCVAVLVNTLNKYNNIYEYWIGSKNDPSDLNVNWHGGMTNVYRHNSRKNAIEICTREKKKHL